MLYVIHEKMNLHNTNFESICLIFFGGGFLNSYLLFMMYVRCSGRTTGMENYEIGNDR